MSTATLNRCKRIPLAKLTTAFDGARVRARMWWVIENGDALFYNGYAAQCNANEELTKRLRNKLYPGAEVVFIEAAFCPDND